MLALCMSGQLVNHLAGQVAGSLSNQLDGWFSNLQDKYTPGVRAQREAYQAQEEAHRLYAQQQALAKQTKESYEVLQERNRTAHEKRIATSRADQTASKRPRSSATRS